MRDLLFLLLLIALLELASAKWELKPSISISGGWGGKRKSSKSSKSRCPQPPPPPPSLHNCPDPNLPVHNACGSSVELTPLYRSYNKKIRDHFYTVDPAEQQNAARDGFDIEGQTGFIGTLAPAHCPGMVPLYRMWSNSAKDHFYTTNDVEMRSAQGKYTLEGKIGYCSGEPGCGLVPLHRFWNPENKDHFYTNDENEKNSVQRDGAYCYEGIQCYVWKSK